MKTVIYLIRHGQSEGNKYSRCLGHTDLSLTDLGMEQARLTADHLRDVKIDAIYSSDLKRAYETALPHAQYRNMNIYTSKELREMYFGEWENQCVDDLRANFPEQFNNGWRAGFGLFTIPGGENTYDAACRMEREVLRISAMHPDKTILIASHAAVIRALWCKISGFAPEDWAEKLPFPSNSSYSILECDGEKLYPISFSNDEHLGDLVTTVMK